MIDGTSWFWITCSCGWSTEDHRMGQWNWTQADHWKSARKHWADATGATPWHPSRRPVSGPLQVEQLFEYE